ncbi:MAG TPA: hypothetical protein VGO71_02825 [Baekduia sp.]|nr:hypothetical protein [Baekduia sp.]
MSTGALAARTLITGRDVKNGSLTGIDIKDKSIGSKDIRAQRARRATPARRPAPRAAT